MGLKAGLQIIQQAGKVATGYVDVAVGIFCRKPITVNPAELKGLRFAPKAIGDTVKFSSSDELVEVLRKRIRKLLPKGKYSTARWEASELKALEERYLLEPENRKHIEAMLSNDYVYSEYSNIEELLACYKQFNAGQKKILDKFIKDTVDMDFPCMLQVREFMEIEGFKVLTDDMYNIIKKYKYPRSTIQYGLSQNNMHLVSDYYRRFGALEDEIIPLEALLVGTKGVKNISLEQAMLDIRELADIKKIDGNRLYNFEYLTHQLSMGEILRCKYNDPERYKNMMQLIKLSSEEMVSYQPTFFMPHGNLYQGVVDDMLALSQGKGYYPKFASSVVIDDVLKSTKLGEAISIGDKMYVRDTEKLIELKMSSKCYETLFPAVDRYIISQGELPTCSGLSFLNNLLQEPKSRAYFYQLFEQNGDNILIKKNLHSSDILTEFNWKEIGTISEKASKGNPMIQILEQLYNTGGYSLDKLGLNSEVLSTVEIPSMKTLVANDKICSMRSCIRSLEDGIGADHVHSWTDLTEKSVRLVNPWGSADGRKFSLDYLKEKMNGLIFVELS